MVCGYTLFQAGGEGAGPALTLSSSLPNNQQGPTSHEEAKAGEVRVGCSQARISGFQDDPVHWD